MNKFIFTIFIIFGSAVGTAVGKMFEKDIPWLGFGIDIGLKQPLNVDLYVLDFTLGFGMQINVAGIIGLIAFSLIALKLFKWGI